MTADAQRVFEENLTWAEGIARKCAVRLPPSFDLDDLMQVARIELWKQSGRWKPERNDSFRAFAYQAVRGAVLMACRRRHWTAATMDELHEQHVDSADRPDEAIDRKRARLRERWREARRRQLLKAKLKRLGPVEAYLVQQVVIERVDPEVMARRWNVPVDYIQRRLQAAKRRLARMTK